MQLPKSTGEAAKALGVSEPRLNDLIRRGRINPAPRLFAGRRLWEVTHIRQAARVLGVTFMESADETSANNEEAQR